MLATKQTITIKFLRNISIILSPFLLMIIINEAARIKIKEKPYIAQGVAAMNSDGYYPEKCSWACHNKTAYCKTYHVKYLKPYFTVTDKFYFGAISALASTGFYGVANIIFLVFLFPFIILYFVINSLNIQDNIGKIKR